MRYLLSVTLLAASLSLICQPALAKKEHGHNPNTGGQSAEHMSAEGSENSNGAAMADREKGQMRSDDRAAEASEQGQKDNRKGDKPGRGKKR